MSPTTDSPDVIRRKLEGELAFHQAAILDIQWRINASVSINRLPTELLALVFRFCRDARSYRLDAYKMHSLEHSVGRRWIYVTWVCRHWRTVALYEPRLWNEINLNHLGLIQPCLVRSKAVPLHVFVSSYPPITRNQHFRVLESMDRIHTFDIIMYSEHPEPPLLLPAVATPLRSLSLRSYTKQSSFLTQLRHCKFPSLHELKVVNCVKDIPTSLFGHALTHLELVASRTDSRIHMELDFFAERLSRMPQLENLVIRRIRFTPSNGSHIPQLPSIHLTHLQWLHLESSPDTYMPYAGLLECLNIPTYTRSHIKFQAPFPDIDPPTIYPPILSLLKAKTIRSLSFEVKSGRGMFKLAAWPEVVDFTKHIPTGEIEPSTVVRLPYSILYDYFTWYPFFDALEVKDVESLYVAVGDVGPNPGMKWKCLFGRFDRLTTLHSRGNSGNYIPEMLGIGGNGIRPPIAPRLQTIHISDMHWTSLSSTQGLSFVLLLSDTLMTRPKEYAIQRLVIKSCFGVYHSDIELLQASVKNVRWDGQGSDSGVYTADFTDSEEIDDICEDSDDEWVG